MCVEGGVLWDSSPTLSPALQVGKGYLSPGPGWQVKFCSVENLLNRAAAGQVKEEAHLPLVMSHFLALCRTYRAVDSPPQGVPDWPRARLWNSLQQPLARFPGN